MAKRKSKKKAEATAEPETAEEAPLEVELEPRPAPAPPTKEQAAALTAMMVKIEAMNEATREVGNPFVEIVEGSSASTDVTQVGVPIWSPDQIQQLRVRVSAAKHDTEQAASLLAALSQALPILLAL